MIGPKLLQYFSKGILTSEQITYSHHTHGMLLLFPGFLDASIYLREKSGAHTGNLTARGRQASMSENPDPQVNLSHIFHNIMG